MPGQSAKRSDDERKSKIDTVIELLERNNGATLQEMIEATGWQSHSTRAVLTGLKKKGYVVTREKTDGVSRYRISRPIPA